MTIPDYLRVAIKLIMKDRDRFFNTFQLWEWDPHDECKITLSAQESAVLADIMVDSDMLEVKNKEPFYPEVRKNRKGMKEKRDVMWPSKEVSSNRIKGIIAEFNAYGISEDEIIEHINKRDDDSIIERDMEHLVKTINMLKKGVTWESILDMKNYGKRDD